MSNTVLDTWRTAFLHSVPDPVTCLALKICGSCPYVTGGERSSPPLVVSGSELLVIFQKQINFLRLSWEDEIL